MNAQSDALMSTYGRLPVTFTRGEGVWLWDDKGQKYLDAIAGIAVCGLGHCHPEVTAAISAQAATLVHISNLYHIAEQERLATLLQQYSGMERVFFGNSGAEANEAAIKIARKYGHSKNIDVPVILVMEHAFHGRTMATLTATANPKVQHGFAPLLEGFQRVPFNDVVAVEEALKQNKSIVAVMLEPIQGEGGLQPPSSGYLQALRTLCDQHECLLICDEIQSGMGRTGKLFAYQHENILPDVVTLAKGLANGLPIGACLARGEAAEVLTPGSHGSTFGGNPLCCHVGYTTLEIIAKPDTLEHVRQISTYLRNGLSKALNQVNAVRDIRGQGLMMGIELDRPCAEIVKLALERHLLINVTANKVIRILPALILQEHEADQIISILAELIQEFCND